jgi:hypothetical protein
VVNNVESFAAVPMILKRCRLVSFFELGQNTWHENLPAQRSYNNPDCSGLTV